MFSRQVRTLFFAVAYLSQTGLVTAAPKTSAPASKPQAAPEKAAAGTSSAAECSIVVEGTDSMQYQQNGKKLETITAPSNCPNNAFTVTLKHVGKLAKQIMGHNLVVTASGDAATINTEAMKLGPTKNYLADVTVEPFKTKVLATAMKLLGGGESEDIKVDMTRFKKGGDYTFFCTFPGHFSMMQGKFVVR
ncbi:MAG: azurin [Oligoflexales bacterium]|nr:azurin [Oligoflexales bacterium]